MRDRAGTAVTTKDIRLLTFRCCIEMMITGPTRPYECRICNVSQSRNLFRKKGRDIWQCETCQLLF